MIKKILVLLAGIWLFGAGSFVSAKEEIVDRIVAIVNDDIITLSQLDKEIQPFTEKIAVSDQPPAEKSRMIRSVEQDILAKLIDRTLTRQQAARYQISVSDTDVLAAMENFKQKNGMDQQALEKGLEAEGITLEEYQERIREDILQSMLINRAVKSKVIITQADIEAYYEAHEEKFKGKKKYQLRNILMETQKDIQDVVRRLEKNLSFQEAARQYSMASNADGGGYLGIFDIDNFSEAIREAVLPLKKGEYSRVIQTGSGYQIIYVEDILATGGQTLEQATDEIQDILFQEQVEQKFSDWIASLKKNAHIKIML